MKPEACSQFYDFTKRFEGECAWMYLDVLGLVTTGCGNLIDPIGLALGLPWKIGEYRATEQEIRDSWNFVKSRDDLKLRGGGVYADLTDLRLSDTSIRALVTDKMLEMESILRVRFPGWEDLPWQAQLATLSLAWACGPRFRFPKFELALNAMDFYTCAVECRINEVGNPGIIPRNAANKQLFLEAAHSEEPPTTPDTPLAKAEE